MKCIFYKIIFILIISCSKDFNDKNLIELKFNSLESINKSHYTELIDSVIILPLETNKECLIEYVSSVNIFNDLILIYDYINDNLFVFNNIGEYINKIGSIGRGPDQYVNLKAFYIDKDKNTINIFDNAIECVHTYSLNGDYIERKIYNDKNLNEIDYCIQINENTLICYSSLNNYSKLCFYEVDICDYSIKKTLYKHKIDLKSGRIRYSKSPFIFHNNEIKFVSILDPILYTYENNLIPFMKLSDGKRKYNVKQFQNLSERMTSFFTEISDIHNKGQYTLGFFDIFEIERFLFLKTFHDEGIIWDKKLNSGIYINKEKYIEWGNITATYKDSFIQVWDINQLKERKTIFPQHIELIDNLNLYDNPVLVFRKMKN